MSLQKFYNIAKNNLFPLCRSITGNNNRKTLKIIKKEFKNLRIHEVKSGTQVYDWKVPKEWNINDAYIIDKYGRKILDFKINNLHVVGYSSPINKKINKKRLLKKLHTNKKLIDAIPYLTSYYKDYWGFCIEYTKYKKIISDYKDTDLFHVLIDSSFKKKGSLTYGELILKGESKSEILVSTYICHPSMANNELSGMIVSMGLANYFTKKKLKKTIRFIFIPETIGSITYLARNFSYLKKHVIGGYNLSCIGDNNNHSCMFTKYENTQSDKALIEAYKKLRITYKKYSFLKRGSDERQYNSPGIELPIASIFRTKYGEYYQYHTSLDNFDFVTLKGIKGGFKVAKKAIEILMEKKIPKSRFLCEPQMGKRGLYPTLSTINDKKIITKIMDFLQYSDGLNSIEEISKKIKINILTSNKIYKILKKRSLII